MKLAKKILILAIFIICFLLALKAVSCFQQRYVYKPEIKRTVDQFLVEIKQKQYQDFHKGLFEDENAFQRIKGKISDSYTIIVHKYGGDGYAEVVVSFSKKPQDQLGLVLIPNNTTIFHWNIEYMVSTARD